jgi:hypothetical protein
MTKRLGTWITIALAVLAAMSLLYVGSYLALMQPTPIPQKTGLGLWPCYAKYRIGGDAAESFFGPIQRFDKRIRKRQWYWDADDLELYSRSNP